MPTYEYKCDACGAAFERFQSITAEPVKRCPECGKAKVRRLIGTGAGLIFKGSGFYITDYRDKGYADKAKAEAGGGGDAKSDTKGDTKRDAAKADATPKTESKPAAAAGAGAGAENKPAAPAKSESKPAQSEGKSPKKK